MSDLPDTQAAPEKQGIMVTALKVLTYPLTAASGAYYGWASVRNSSYKNLKSSKDNDGGIFHEEHAKRADDVKELNASGKRGKEYSAARHVIDETYGKATEASLKSHGYGNMWKRFNSLHHSQKLEMVLTTVTAAGVAFTVAETIKDKLQGKDELLQQLTEKENNKSAGR